MEILNENVPRTAVRAVLMDFDGTVSTLRHGWETVMKPLMVEMISGGKMHSDALEREVDAYIDESTGIQTILQMQWLAKAVRRYGLNPGAPDDPWWYKAEYNRRLMARISERIEALKAHTAVHLLDRADAIARRTQLADGVHDAVVVCPRHGVLGSQGGLVDFRFGRDCCDTAQADALDEERVGGAEHTAHIHLAAHIVEHDSDGQLGVMAILLGIHAM